MHKILIVFLLLFSISTTAEDVFKIEIGKNYSRYSDKELRRRVWELERAVFQLQRRIFHLEGKQQGQQPAVANWICTTDAFGDTYTGIGGSKAVAKARAIEKCTKKHNGMHCDDVKCEN